MARKPKPGSKPTFFNILPHDFTRQLKIPTTSVRKHGETLPKRCKLRTSSGETFDVRIEKAKDGKQCCFTGSGWSKFVQDLGLEIGEFLIMWFDGELEFDVSVFQTSGIEKETFRYTPEPSEFNGDEILINQGVDNGAAETGVGPNGDTSKLRPWFEVVMTENRRYRLTFPKGFALNAGLIDAKSVVLKYLRNKTRWVVLLEQSRYKGQPRFDLATGWGKFRKTNGLIYGNTYSFTFNPSENVIQVESVRKN